LEGAVFPFLGGPFSDIVFRSLEVKLWIVLLIHLIAVGVVVLQLVTGSRDQ
jgi:hypothetical protein